MGFRERLVASFEIVAGITVALWWVGALVAGEVPGLDDGDRTVWFHLAADSSMALLLATGGALLWRNRSRRRLVVSVVALGMLLYSVLNSVGHFADVEQWAIVAFFGVLMVGTLLALVVVFAGLGAGEREPVGQAGR